MRAHGATAKRYAALLPCDQAHRSPTSGNCPKAAQYRALEPEVDAAGRNAALGIGFGLAAVAGGAALVLLASSNDRAIGSLRFGPRFDHSAMGAFVGGSFSARNGANRAGRCGQALPVGRTTTGVGMGWRAGDEDRMNDAGTSSVDAATDTRYVHCACRAPDGSCPPQCLSDCPTAVECMELPDDIPPTYEHHRSDPPDASGMTGAAPKHGGCAGCTVAANASELYSAWLLAVIVVVFVARRVPAGSECDQDRDRSGP